MGKGGVFIMRIESILDTPAKQSRHKTNRNYTFPLLERSTDGELVVLFKELGKGTVVHIDKTKEVSGRTLGEYRTDWCMAAFRKLKPNERVTLSSIDE